VVEVDAGGDQHDQDRGDDPVDDQAERRPPPLAQAKRGSPRSRLSRMPNTNTANGSSRLAIQRPVRTARERFFLRLTISRSKP
jgi:hypothetical protein